LPSDSPPSKLATTKPPDHSTGDSPTRTSTSYSSASPPETPDELTGATTRANKATSGSVGWNRDQTPGVNQCHPMAPRHLVARLLRAGDMSSATERRLRPLLGACGSASGGHTVVHSPTSGVNDCLTTDAVLPGNKIIRKPPQRSDTLSSRNWQPRSRAPPGRIAGISEPEEPPAHRGAHALLQKTARLQRFASDRI
jgi:hypothetical protein